ncbi:hypothetical protein ZPAH1_orf00078 [Aeromonas phage ZPAH1]|nr:hypothetical protein ASwh1_30 [Aeromonas phage Aswh_1]QQG33840.1 hypothetical protein ZPAH1_orf00078 [Aeromonas phage ZPAH1]
MARSQELIEKAKELAEKIKEVRELASQNDYGMEIEHGQIRFEDWLSSSCYGEGGEGFTVDEDDNHVWEESSC